MKWTSRQGLIALFLFVILIQLYWHNAKMNRTHNHYLASIALENDYRRNIEQRLYHSISRYTTNLGHYSHLRELSNIDSFLEQAKQIYPDYAPPKRKEKIDSIEIYYQKAELWKYVLEDIQIISPISIYNYQLSMVFRPDTGQYANFYFFKAAAPKRPSHFSFIADGKEHKIDRFPFYTASKPIKIIVQPLFERRETFEEKLYEEE